MINKNTYKFADCFFKTAVSNLMQMGTSTVNMQEAKQLAQFAKTGIEQLKKINPYLYNQFPHANFESVVNSLLENKAPPQTEISKAIQEFYGSMPLTNKQMTPEEWSQIPGPLNTITVFDSPENALRERFKVLNTLV